MFRLFNRRTTFLPSLQWRDFIVLFGGVIVFAGLAISTVTKFSIWFDEGFGSYLIRFNFADLTRYTAHDVHPPLYYWALKIWSLAFGNTELGIRSMSIFFGVLTVVFAFILVFRLFGRRAAYISLLFLVISPMLVRYSQEARMYTMLTAIIVAATYMLVYATQSNKRWAWITYGILIALGMLTQYFAALAWLAHWVWRSVTVRKNGDSFNQTMKKVLSKQWILAYGVSLAVFAFWLPFMALQFADVQGNGFWIGPVTSATVANFFTDVLLFSNWSGAESWLALGFYFLVVLVCFSSFKLLKVLKGEQRNNYLLLIIMIVIPLVLLVLASMPPLRSAFVDRYLMGSVVFLSLFLGVTLTFSKGIIGTKLRVLVGLVVVAMMVVGAYNQMVVGNYNKSSGQSNNVKQLVNKVHEVALVNTPIIANSPWIFYEAAIYGTDESPIYFVNETTQYKYGSLLALKEDDTFKINDVDAFMNDHKSFWYIANIRGSMIRPLRDNWQKHETITINDDQTGKPVFAATHFTVE